MADPMEASPDLQQHYVQWSLALDSSLERVRALRLLSAELRITEFEVEPESDQTEIKIQRLRLKVELLGHQLTIFRLRRIIRAFDVEIPTLREFLTAWKHEHIQELLTQYTENLLV
jgi:hypothetical protein